MSLSRRSLLVCALAIPVAGTILRPAYAASPEVYSTKGVAISGYDAVAYFTEGKAVAGDPRYAVKWHGAMWQFASAANRDEFEMHPMGYAPQFGGYCAYAVSKGAVATTDPEAWTIHGGKLYLNYSTSVRTIWSQDKPGNIQRAEANWPAVLGK